MPPAMLERILRQSDPVVTCGGGLLRFEGFSACASVYARVDLTPDAYTGVVVAQGTTNVDFNAPFRAALAQIRDHDRVGFAIGTDEVALLRGSEQFVERKVDLPLRWLRSFAEVQACQARLEPRLELGKVETLRFLRALPRAASPRTAFWIVPAASGLRLSQRPCEGAMRISGIDRLRVLEELAPYAQRLRVFAHADHASSEWQLDFGPLRFSLTLSPDVWRGFSGEGQLLSALAAQRDAALELVRRTLQWQAELRAEDLTTQITAPLDVIRLALATLGSRGLVGYDLAREAYFHRELPFNLSAVDELHPRLAAARELVARQAVTLLRHTSDILEADVASGDVVHRVKLDAAGARCTCPWHAKHQGDRGPCKHVLATHLHAENQSAAHASNPERA